MILPNGVLVYRVLNSANLNQEEMKLCRATITELKYDMMVKQLVKIYGDTASPNVSNAGEVKEEPVFYGNVSNRGKGNYRGTSRGKTFQVRENDNNDG